MRKYRRLTWENRVQIETLLNAGVKVTEIANRLGFTFSAIYKELKHGYYMHKNTDWTYTRKYSAYKAQEHMLFEKTTKGAQLKIGNDYELLAFIEDKIINEHLSPDAVLGLIKRDNLQFKTSICRVTLYSYIDKGLFMNLTNKDLRIKGKKKKHKKIRVAKKGTLGKTIEQRDISILTRDEFGHWELDTVVGKRTRDAVLFVFTERKTRQEIIVKGKDKSAVTCVNILNKLERHYGKRFKKIFKSITCDNGCEFSNFIGMESSIYRTRQPRTQVYYCHPYCSSERGSNENQNKMIRRFIPKSTAIGEYSLAFIQEVQDYINNYPRRIFGYKTSQMLFNEELEKII